MILLSHSRYQIVCSMFAFHRNSKMMGLVDQIDFETIPFNIRLHHEIYLTIVLFVIIRLSFYCRFQSNGFCEHKQNETNNLETNNNSKLLIYRFRSL